MAQSRKKTVKKSITVKEAKLVKATAEGKNQTEAGLIADPNRRPESARVWANETLQKPTVKEALQLALEEAGLTPKKVIGVVKDGMEAQRLVIVGNGEEAMADLQPDHSIRLKAAGMAAKFMGLDSKPAEGNTYNFTQINNDMGSKYAD